MVTSLLLTKVISYSSGGLGKTDLEIYQYLQIPLPEANPVRLVSAQTEKNAFSAAIQIASLTFFKTSLYEYFFV